MIFHLNVFLPFIAFLIVFFVWTYIISIDKFNKPNRVLLLSLSSILIYLFLIFYIRIANDLENNMFLLKLIPITYLPMGFLFLNFTYHLLSKKRDAILWGFSLIVWLSVGINIFTDFFVTKFIASEWGYHLQFLNPYSFYCAFIIVSTPIFFGLYNLIKEIYQNLQSPYQSQIKLILVGTTFILTVVILFEYTIFNFELYETIRLAPIGVAAIVLLLLPSIIKYNFTTRSKHKISTKLFSSLPEAIFLLDEKGIIVESNMAANNIIESTNLSNIEEVSAHHLFVNYSHTQNYKDYISRLIFNQTTSISISQSDYKEYGFKMGKLLIVRDISKGLLSEQQLRQAQEISHTGSFQYDLISDKVIWSEELYRIYQRDSRTYSPTNDNFLSEIVHPDDKNRIKELVSKNIHSMKSFEYTYRIILPNNEERTMFCICIVTLNHENVPICIDGTAQDITELEETRIELLESEKKYRSLFEESPDPIIIHDDTNIYYCNSAAVKLGNLNSVKELLTLKINDFFSDQYIEEAKLNINNYMAGNHVKLNRQEIILPNGKTLYIEAKGVRTDYNKIPVIQSSIRDVTFRVLAEKQLQESEERYRKTIESSSDIIFSTDLDGNITFVNAVFESISGYTETEVLGKDINVLVSSKYQENIKKTYLDFFNSTEKNFITTILAQSKMGKDVWLELNMSKIKEGKYVLGFTTIARDITERKKIEKALFASEEKYRLLVEHSTEMIYKIDLEGKYTFVNQVMVKNMGYTKEVILSMNCFETIVKEHHDDVRTFYTNQIKTNKQIAFYEIPCFGKDKKVYWIGQISRMDKDNNGNPIGFTITARDITQKHKAEIELKNSEERYRKLVEASPDAIIIHNLEKGILFVNNAALKLSGATSKDQFIGKSPMAFVDVSSFERVQSRIERIYKGEEIDYKHEVFLKVDGTTLDAEAKAVLITFDNEPAIQSTIRDISDRMRSEHILESNRLQMLQAQNIAQLGSWEWDITTNEVIWSDNLYSLYGTDRNSFKVTFEGFMSRVHPDDQEYVTNIITECANTQIPMDYYHRTVPINGQIHTMHCNGIVISDKKGLPLTMVGTAQDVTKEVGADLALKESEARLVNAQKMAHMGNWEENHKTGDIYWSDECKKILGFKIDENITHRMFWEIVHPEDLKKLKAKWEEIENTLKTHEGTFRIILTDGEIRYIREKSFFIVGDDGKLEITKATIQDITELEVSNIELEISQFRLKQAQQLAHIGNWEFDSTKEYIYMSDQCKYLYGFRKNKKIKVNDIWRIIHPDDHDWLKQLWKKSKLTLKSYKVIYRILIKEKIKYLCESTEFTTSKDIKGFRCLATVQDVTIQKNAENDIKASREQLRDLSKHLQTIQEDERAYIAREIHDELGQRLTGIKMDLAWIKGKMSTEDEGLFKRISSLNNLIDDTVQSVRKISSELHPVILDDLGLKAAMEWQISEFTRRSPIICNLQMDDEVFDFDKIQSKAIFRIMQESLTNVMRHAKAKHVDIILNKNKEHIILSINDDGIGMEKVAETIHNSFGILGMKERAYSLGGFLSISSKLDKGTNIILKIPIDMEKS